MPSGGDQIFDGVGWILRNPQHLFVQVNTMKDPKEGFQILDHLPDFMRSETAGGDQKPNLMGVNKGGADFNARDWGYTVGLLNGRSAIVTPSSESVDWETAANAQRAKQQSYFVVGLFFLGGLMFRG